MDKQTRLTLIKNIKQQIEELQREIGHMQERADTVELGQPIGRLSRMDSLTNQGIALSSLNKAGVRLARLEMALNRAEKDEEFGCCEECGEEIAWKRLMAMPEATLCINCAR